MPAPAIVAAIITATTAVGTTAASEVATAVRSASSGVGAVVENLSDANMKVHSFAPNHGHYIQGPATKLYGVDYELKKFNAALKAKYGDNPTDAERDALLKEWQAADQFEKLGKTSILEYEGCGDGAGFETAILLEATSAVYFQLAILIRKRPGGDYGVGLGVANYAFYSTKDDEYGEKIIDHIKDVHTSRCQYSDGGGSISVDIYGYKVTATAPGEVITIQIENA